MWSVSLSILWSTAFLFSNLVAASEAPVYLFHAGAHATLLEDVTARTIPAKAWDTFIFGKTGFDLPQYRKGLYGAEDISATSLYSSYNFLSGVEPWVIAIRLKKSCRSEEAAFNSDTTIDFNRPQRPFEKWYLAHREKYRNLEKLCLNMTTAEQGNWEEGAPYNVSTADPLTQRQTRLCGNVISDFLEDLKIKIVLDVANDKSWYVRDRNCIDSVLGTPNELFNLIFTRQIGSADTWSENFLGDAAAPGFSFPGNTVLLLNILSRATIGAAEIQKIESIQQELNNSLGPQQDRTTMIETPQLEKTDDDPRIIATALKATIRAQRKGQLFQFQKALRRRVKTLIQKLGEQCKAQNGVPESRNKQCIIESAHQSLLLDGFFNSILHD